MDSIPLLPKYSITAAYCPSLHIIKARRRPHMSQDKFSRELEKTLDTLIKKHPIELGLVVVAGGAYYFRDKIILKVKEFMPDLVFGFKILFWSMIVLFVLNIIRKITLTRLERKNYQYALIIPHESDFQSKDVDALNQMIQEVHRSKRKPLQRLCKGRDWYRMMMYRPKEDELSKVRIYLGGPKDGIKQIINAFQSRYTHAEIYPQSMEEVPFPSKKAVGGRLVFVKKDWKAMLPLATYKKDILVQLMNNIAEETWVDVSFSPDNGYKLKKNIRNAEKELRKQKKGQGLDLFEDKQLKALKDRVSGSEVTFQVAVSFASEKYEGVDAIKHLGHMVESIMASTNELRYKKKRKNVIPAVPKPKYGNMMWTGSELLNVLHLPNIKSESNNLKEEKIVYLKSGEELLPSKVLQTGLTIGYLKHPYFTAREVAIPSVQFRKHGSITGGTGSGKSTIAARVLQSIIDQVLEGKENADGFTLFDPKPELSFVMLNRLLKAEQEGKKVDWSKIHYIRFRDTEHPPALNLMHRFEGEDIQSVVDSVMTLIKHTIPGHAQQTERLLKAIIGTLLCDREQEHTILSVGKFLSDELFRERVIANLEGPDTQYYLNFWKNEVDTTLEDSKQAILNRLDIFRNTVYLKRMYGQTGFSLDICKWMDEGHLVFFDLSGMSKMDIDLTVNYIMNKYYELSKKRKDVNRTHCTFIDEGHKVKVPILPTIIAELRSLGVALWMITQSMDQLDRELTLALKDISANFFICKQGSSGANELEKITQGQFSAYYLQNLPPRVVAIQTQGVVSGQEQDIWCTVNVPPLDKYLPNGEVATYGDKQKQAEADTWTKAKMKELEQRGKHADEIDNEISMFLYGKSAIKLQKEEKKAIQLQKAEQSQGSILVLEEEDYKHTGDMGTNEDIVTQEYIFDEEGNSERESDWDLPFTVSSSDTEKVQPQPYVNLSKDSIFTLEEGVNRAEGSTTNEGGTVPVAVFEQEPDLVDEQEEKQPIVRDSLF